MNNKIKENYTFRTSDLGFAAALLSNRYAELIGLEKSNPKRVEFVLRFPNEDDFNFWGGEYSMGQIEVDALTYFNAIKTLKNRIYSDTQQVKGGLLCKEPAG